ncbi:MAG: AMP-binding protein, partial [Thermodesulfobacteriota bacterium]|nr:AMP-binding protein [Thermodesulfobacteriota bacterium]
GEVLIGGDTVFKGYLNKPEQTAEVLKDGWLYTGDVGEWDDEGFLHIVDRKKDIIITAGGKNIAPSALENQMKFSPYIKEVIVIGDGRKFPSALIQFEMENVENWAQKRMIPYTTYKSLAKNPEVQKLIAGIVAEANSHFARVERVKEFRVLEKELDPDDNELTGTMKAKRRVIEEKYKDIIADIYKE